MNFLTTKEAAGRLGVTTVRVCAMITAGRLPAQRFGRAYMIKEADLKLVQDRKPGRPAQKPAETTKRLNQAFRKVTDEEAKPKKAGKKG